MQTDILKNTPFRDFLIPGLILFAVNCLGNIASAVFSLRFHRITGLGGLFFGFGLIIWLFVQVNMIGGGPFLLKRSRLPALRRCILEQGEFLAAAQFIHVPYFKRPVAANHLEIFLGHVPEMRLKAGMNRPL
jgi:hypothetical protein